MAKIDEVLICKALGDPNRMEIVKMLSNQEKCGCKLLEKFDYPLLLRDLYHENVSPFLQKCFYMHKLEVI